MVTLRPFKHDFWYSEFAKEQNNISVVCLMPTGVTICFDCPITYTLAEMKEMLWKEAENHAFYWLLEAKSFYTIKAIKSFSALLEEIHDESQRIIDIQPFFALFRIERRQQSNESNELKQKRIRLIGKRLDNYLNPEINDFRSHISTLCDLQGRTRKLMSGREKIIHANPPSLAESPQIPVVVQRHLDINMECIFEVHFPAEYFQGIDALTMKTSCLLEVNDFMEKIAKKLDQKANSHAFRHEDFVLKVRGREEYLISNCPLIQYNHVQDAIIRDKNPTFVVTHLLDVPVFPDIPEGPPKKPSIKKRGESEHPTSTLRLTERFQLSIESVLSPLPNEFDKSVGMRIGLFHGDRELCECQFFDVAVGRDRVDWRRTIIFGIDIRDIPRMARICFVIYQTERSAGEVRVPRFWANTTVFDHKGQLKIDGHTLYAWVYTSCAGEADEILVPMGTVEQNPDQKSAVAITFTMPKYLDNTRFTYPGECELAALEKSCHNWVLSPSTMAISKSGEDRLKLIKTTTEMCKCSESISKISAKEREAVWMVRYEIMENYPDFLPILLACVEWNDRMRVSEVVNVLNAWPKQQMTPERILKLLDYNLVDIHVRKFAVSCLKQLRDEVLLTYLLQLIQALKYESHLRCDLADFLLERAIKNNRIGQFLFWHLRSEVHVVAVEMRFSLILEAYLKISQDFMPVLEKQHLCLEKLKLCNDQCKDLPKEKAIQKLMQLLSSHSIRSDLTEVKSPLDPTLKWQNVIENRVRVMDSKKRPFLIFCENFDPFEKEPFGIIFKVGDDLRQDMLILQMLTIMDRTWKSYGYDFRLSIYNCLSMDCELGMIEVVQDCETVANILCKGKFIPDSEKLFEWIKRHNGASEEALNKAINEFVYSCAGYCVATYVLGIGDRHPNNIMVKTNGQMFHIDFGHILGNFKQKLGIKRERCAFVLTKDFVHVINRGKKKDDIDKSDFERFQLLCEEAYIILRKNGAQLLSLFSMMILTGLPELTCVKDLDYLCETLALDRTAEQALDDFRVKFDEALKNSWTQLNWFIHMLNRNNT